MADAYNWTSHYKAPLSPLDDAQGFQRYHLQNESGEGYGTAWSVLPGVQAVYIDLHMLHCAGAALLPLTLLGLVLLSFRLKRLSRRGRHEAH